MAIDGSNTVSLFDNSAALTSTIQVPGLPPITSCSSPNAYRHFFSSFDSSRASVASVISTDYTPLTSSASFPSNTNRFKQVLISHEVNVVNVISKAWALDTNNGILASFNVREVDVGYTTSYTNYQTRTVTNLGFTSGTVMTGIALSLDEQSLFITTKTGLYSLRVSTPNAVVKLIANVTDGFEFRGVAMKPLKCLPGEPGYYCDNKKLRPCKPGTSSFTAGGMCSSCLQGTITADYGMTNCTNCPVGSYGTISSRTTCSLCPEGTYSNTNGSTACTFCEDRIFCPLGSTNNSVICPAGFACKTGFAPLPCPLGTFSFRNLTSCQPCPPGTFCNSTQLSAPIPCPRGRYRVAPGASSLNECLFADPGYFALGNTSFQTRCGVGSIVR